MKVILRGREVEIRSPLEKIKDKAEYIRRREQYERETYIERERQNP